MNDSASSTATQIIAQAPPGVQDLTGRVFGRWTVLRYSHGLPETTSPSYHKWICRCSCSKNVERAVNGYSLLKGYSTSCKCRNREIVTKHGMSRGYTQHFLYKSWSAMHARCQCETNEAYPRYGGRGIKVCERWKNFSLFLEDVLPTWEKGKTMDRIDNDGNYCKENVRWADQTTQCNNQSKNRRLTYKGETLTVAQWARRIGISYMTLIGRITALKWSVEDAIETPCNESGLYVKPKNGKNRIGGKIIRESDGSLSVEI